MPTDQEPALSPVEAALAALAPARAPLDRDRIMFAAGLASSRPSRGFRVPWAPLAAVLALVSAFEGALLAYKPAPEVIYRTVAAREPTPTPPPPVVAAARVDLGLGRTLHDRLAAQVLRYGLDGLSTPTPAAAPGPRPVGSRRLLLEELALDTPTGDPS